MSYRCIVSIFIFTNLRFISLDAQFVCPEHLITMDAGSIGVIPPGRLGLSVIPALYDCEYEFLIAPGWALHFSLSTYYDNFLGDNITFTDNLGIIHVLPTPNQHIEEWATSPEATLRIRTISNSSQMFAIYEFVHVEKKFHHILIPSGEYLALGEMNNQYYTFHSEARDKVALNLAVKNTEDYDTLLDFIFVYDGGDLKNSKMISRLSNYLRKHRVSTSNNITLANFYGVKSPSYIIANDVSKISVFSKYKAILTSRNQQTTGELFDASDQGAAYTWICSDCRQFYWTVLKFYKSRTTISKAYIELKSLSPTHNTSTLLNYTMSSDVREYFPQLIPSRMFTMINHHSAIGVTLDTSMNKITAQNWLTAYDGRKGTIFSPSVWDPMTSPEFSFCFVNGDQKFIFGVNVKDVKIATPGESLTIKAGPNELINSSFQEFVSESAEFWIRRESEGNFMQIAYEGTDRRSMAIVSFDMKQIDSGQRFGCLIALLSCLFFNEL